MLALAAVTLRLGFGNVETVKLSVIFRTVLYTNCFTVIDVENRSTMANLKFVTILIYNYNTIRLRNQSSFQMNKLHEYLLVITNVRTVMGFLVVIITKT